MSWLVKVGETVLHTVEQVRGFLRKEKTEEKIKKEAAQRIKDSPPPINNGSPASERKFLLYCISKCPDRRTRLVLRLRIQFNLTPTQIALALKKTGIHGMTPEKVVQIEEDGRKRVKDALRIMITTGTPIFGNKR